MRRRPLALVLTAALIGAVFTALPAKAAPEIPETPNIVDPAGDANYYSGFAGGPNTVSMGAADLQKVWFTHDATTISVHWLTASNPQPESLNFVTLVDPGTGTDCLNLVGVSAGNASDAYAAIDTRDCADDGAFTKVGEYTEEAGGDDQVIHTSTFPRDAHPSFADGQVLKGPNAFVRHHVQNPATGGSSFATLIDTTDVGTDYTVGSGGGEEPPVVEEPEPPKPPKNPCKKLKGKKKKKCLKKNAVKPCETFKPGELGTDAETFVVTSAATEEAPLEGEVAIGPGAGGFGSVEGNENPAASKAYYNIQVDPEAAEAGLYVRLEFFEFEDYDMILYNPDGTEAANVGGGNVAPVGPLDGTGAGGHSEQGAEQFDGIKSADCQGYTLQITNPQGLGDAPGPLPIKLWLGEVQYDPSAAPAKALVF